MQKTLVLYESRYGSTERAARMISMILGPAMYCRVDDFRDEYKGFDFFVLGSPVYGGKIDRKIMDFAKRNAAWLRDKKTSAFCICLDREDGEKALANFKDLIGPNIVCLKALGGRQNIEKLSEKDAQALKQFSEKTGALLLDVDLFSPEDVVEYAMRLKKIKDSPMKGMPHEELKASIEDFLRSHNTSALATGYGKRIRATPVEYSYNDGKLFLFSEGGEKFANILLNNSVSIAIYNSYEGMESLTGLQITGNAVIAGPGSKEYSEALELKGIAQEKLEALPFIMNVIMIKLEKAEFLNAEFQKMGYGIRQVFFF